MEHAFCPGISPKVNQVDGFGFGATKILVEIRVVEESMVLTTKNMYYIYIYYYVPLQNEDDMSIETASCDVNLYDILRLKLNFGG